MAGKVWTDEEIEDLKFAIKEGLSYKEIGEIFGRTAQAIRLKVLRLGLKPSIKCKTHNQYVEELAIKCPTIIAIEEYKGIFTKILHKCLICNTEYRCEPSSKLQGKGCKYCNGSLVKTHNQYVEELAIKCPTIIVLEEYVNALTKILHKCLLCGMEQLARPSHKLDGHMCMHCGRGSNGFGIDPDKPGITYLVYYYEYNFYKPGVTGQTTKIRNDSQGQKYEIILERHFDTGREAMQLEEEWLANVDEYKINTGVLKSGNTETFRYE